MAIETTLLYREVAMITAEGAKPVIWQWLCIVHANGKNIKPLFTNEVEIERNYIENYCDKIDVELAIPLGVFQYDIVPHRSTLEVTLQRVPLLESVTAQVDLDAVVYSHRYRATLYDSNSELLEGNNPVMATREAAERSAFTQVRLQLIDSVIEQMRMQTVGGVFRNVTGAELVRHLLTLYSRTGSKDKAATIAGVTMAPHFNPLRKDHIVIPHLTRVVDVPERVHKACGGVYSGGFKTYLQAQQWYMYAPYDVTAYPDTPKTLTVINVPSNRLTGSERTYRVTATQVILLVTGQVKHRDNSESAQLNLGNGVRFLDANQIMHGFVTVDGNRMTVLKSKNVNEFVSTPRENGINNVTQSQTRITANPLLENSRLAQRSGAYLQAVWENSNDALLYPGMPVKYMYIQNEEVETIYGVLIGTQTHVSASNINVENRRFISNTTLSMFVDRTVKLTT